MYSDKVIVFVRSSSADFAVLSSSFHLVWLLKWGTTSAGGTPNYKPVECGKTFPFPRPRPHDVQSLLDFGSRFNDYRECLFQDRRLGPTDLYNMLHNEGNSDVDIQKLRDFHLEMDRAVAAAYSWSDLNLGHSFHQTKHGIRFTISESARREVLARLLKFNHERYAEEVAQGLHDKKKGKAASTPRKPKGKDSSEPSLFGEEDG